MAPCGHYHADLPFGAPKEDAAGGISKPQEKLGKTGVCRNPCPTKKDMTQDLKPSALDVRAIWGGASSIPLLLCLLEYKGMLTPTCRRQVRTQKEYEYKPPYTYMFT